MVADPTDVEIATLLLDDGIETGRGTPDDAWMRDIGPTFVLGPAGSDRRRRLGLQRMGRPVLGDLGQGRRIARRVVRHRHFPIVTSPMINEGGGIHVNGEGTVLVTRTVQLGEGRNSDWSQEQVEDELRRTLGVDRIIWLERGLTRDYDQFGTRGHVDIVATFCDPPPCSTTTSATPSTLTSRCPRRSAPPWRSTGSR